VEYFGEEGESFAKKQARKGKVAGLIKESAGEGFKPDAAAGPTKRPKRNHIRLRRVG